MNIRTITREQIKKLSEPELKVNEDKHIEHIVEQHFRNYGQLKIPIICVVDGKVRVVDGMKYLKTTSKIVKEIKVNYIGGLDLKTFITLRLYMNFTNQRTHYINIAKAVSKIIINVQDINSVANGTNLTPIEVERYSELLEFDWSTFSKQEINKDHLELF